MPASLKPDRILKELSELWTNMGKPEAGEKASDGGVLRACAMTLIAIVDDSDDPMELGETLALLMRDHPSRAIVLRLSESPDGLEGRVFAQCWMPFGHRRQICCEQVEITVSLNRLEDIPSIVAPLAVPDLPRIVWLRTSRLPDTAITEQLLSLGDRIIIDSERPGAPTLGSLRKLLERGHLVGDLAWARITGARELLAQHLEGKLVQSAEVDFCGTEPNPEAAYLAGWLKCVYPNQDVELRQAMGDTRLREVRIRPDVHVKLGGGCTDFQIAGTDYELLNEELRIVVHDPVFERVLRQVT